MNKSKNAFSYFYKAKPEDKDEKFWKNWKAVCEKRHMIYVDSVEIAGLMNDESYKSKIIYKRDTFKCMVLTKKSEFNNFI